MSATLAPGDVMPAGYGSTHRVRPRRRTALLRGRTSSDGTAAPTELDFTATTIDGQPFSGQSLAGNPVAMWFWAPWCPVCQREAPTVAQAASNNPEVTFVGVGALDQAPAMREFVDKYAVGEFTQLADTDAAVWAKFGVTQQPAFAFITPAGEVDVVRGTLSDTELRERLAALPQ